MFGNAPAEAKREGAGYASSPLPKQNKSEKMERIDYDLFAHFKEEEQERCPECKELISEEFYSCTCPPIEIETDNQEY